MPATSPRRDARAFTVGALLEQLDTALRERTAAELVPIETGFGVIDQMLGGGLRPGDLTLLGGPPGVGKTIVALQWARNIARDGFAVVFANYEHEESQLLTRLLAMEAGEVGADSASTAKLGMRLQEAAAQGQSLAAAIGDDAVGREALDRMGDYADTLSLVRASGAHTGLPKLEDLVSSEKPAVLMVDYLQKVAMHPEPDLESEKVTRVVEGLKDLALTHRVAVVSVAAVDAAGLRTRRLRLHHLRGSSALAFEADVALMVNDKTQAVSKVHLAYDPLRAQTFRQWVVVSIEKNRGGPNLVDLEFRKDFEHFRFDPDGGIVSERLVDETLDEEA